MPRATNAAASHRRRKKTIKLARLNGLTYGQLIHGMKLARIEIDRKLLAELAVNDPPAFTVVADAAKAQFS